MKRFLIILLLIIFTTDSFASGIASNTATAPCTNTTLETYSGNTNLAADWQPNTIDLRWYDNNTLLTVQSAANTCVYDGTLTIPSTAPTRTGYTFAGWQVRPEYDFSTLPVNESGTEAWGLGATGYRCHYNQTSGKCEYSGCPNTLDFSGLDRGEWKTSFSWGTLYGTSMISSSNTTPTESENGTYCFCRATGYIPNNGNIKYAPKSSNWVYNSNCENICKSICGCRCALYTTPWWPNSLNKIKYLLQSN